MVSVARLHVKFVTFFPFCSFQIFVEMSDLEMNITFVGEMEKCDVLSNYKLPGYSRKDIMEKKRGNRWQQK